MEKKEKRLRGAVKKGAVCAICGRPLAQTPAVVGSCPIAGGAICMGHCFADGGCRYCTSWGCSYYWESVKKEREEQKDAGDGGGIRQ